ncbi:hypothetical protein C8J56DRAFT_1052115 [Mycena floridula]|nr:hypothetical protein C8J56DRAFT_1052115 [Mycena floridula]
MNTATSSGPGPSIQPSPGPSKLHLFDGSLLDVEAIPPPAIITEAYSWPLDQRSTAGPPKPVGPIKAANTPPSGSYFPLAPVYDERAKIIQIVTPEDTHVDIETDFDPNIKSFVPKEIGGMLRMVAGTPYAVEIHGEASRRLTIACLQTPESMDEYPQGPRICQLSRELFLITWGGDQTEKVDALLDMHLTPNDRSGAPQPGRADGSYSCSCSVNGGHGKGTCKPACQSQTEPGQAHIERLLAILNELFSLVMPACVTRNEWDVTQFMSHFLNVVPMGGPCRGPTSCLYVHEFVELILGSGWFILFIAFKGNDPHVGTPPAVIAEAKEQLVTSLQDIQANVQPECCAGYVLYAGEGPCQQTIDHSFGPALRFGQQPNVVRYKKVLTNFLEHGYPAVGSRANHAQYIFQELLCHNWNAVQHSRTLRMDMEKFLQAFSIADECNPDNLSLKLAPHPIKDAAHIAEMKGRYKWLLENSQLYYIYFTKSDLRRAKDTRNKEAVGPGPFLNPNELTNLHEDGLAGHSDQYAVEYKSHPGTQYWVTWDQLQICASSAMIDKFEASLSSDEISTIVASVEPEPPEPDIPGIPVTKQAKKKDIIASVVSLSAAKQILDKCHTEYSHLQATQQLGALLGQPLLHLLSVQNKILQTTSSDSTLSFLQSLQSLQLSAKLIGFCDIELTRTQFHIHSVQWHLARSCVYLWEGFALTGPLRLRQLF